VRAAAVGLGGWVALGLLVPMEAGVPIPLPADLVMFGVGERVAAGAFPLWLAVAGFEVIAVIGTSVLFLTCRGPAHRVIARFGPRLGLTGARVRRAATLVETRGRPALAVGRGTPGLRTLTVVAAGVSGVSWKRALPALILGSSVFLQLHLVLGLLLGPLAYRAFHQATVPALVALGVLLVGALIFWRARRGKRAANEAWAEAACPACIGLSLVAQHVPALAGLTGPEASVSAVSAEGPAAHPARSLRRPALRRTLPPGRADAAEDIDP
jgi:membrane protein DedA with SNARE-associated domain